jgi:dihydrofolate synthase/folylpolyglutamate synthase
MNYTEAIEYIENTGKFGINLGLKRIERLCELLGDPQKDLKVIHVGGTNGKGSTTAFISSILISQGYKVGIYTSPYIERFTERIKINDKEIEKEEIAKLVNDIKPVVDTLVSEGLEHPTEFEIITACAFKYFKDNNVDFVVLEVGLGGRFDATNVVDPILSVITTISYDHMNILGDTLNKIAYEKAGIIKNNRPVVIYPQEKEAMDALLEAAEKSNSRIYPMENVKQRIRENNINGITFDILGPCNYNGLKIKLLGEHQVMNAATAVTAIEALKDEGFIVDRDSVYNGLKNTKWPGRFEIIHDSPYIVLDGGHNIQGIEALAKAVKKYFDKYKINIVCGMLQDKEYNKMIDILQVVGDKFITVTPDNPRALKSSELALILQKRGKNAVSAESIEQAVKMGLEITKQDEVLIFCGSLYMIGHARSVLKTIGKSNLLPCK